MQEALASIPSTTTRKGRGKEGKKERKGRKDALITM
jgi:hypothetical protein